MGLEEIRDCCAHLFTDTCLQHDIMAPAAALDGQTVSQTDRPLLVAARCPPCREWNLFYVVYDELVSGFLNWRIQLNKWKLIINGSMSSSGHKTVNLKLNYHFHVVTEIPSGKISIRNNDC